MILDKAKHLKWTNAANNDTMLHWRKLRTKYKREKEVPSQHNARPRKEMSLADNKSYRPFGWFERTKLQWNQKDILIFIIQGSMLWIEFKKSKHQVTGRKEVYSMMALCTTSNHYISITSSSVHIMTRNCDSKHPLNDGSRWSLLIMLSNASKDWIPPNLILQYSHIIHYVHMSKPLNWAAKRVEF